MPRPAGEFLQSMRPLWSTLVLAAIVTAVPLRGAAAENAPQVHGAALSQVEPHRRLLTVTASATDSDSHASGWLRFEHRSPDGVSWFAGSVTCVQEERTGILSLGGTIGKGRTAAGDDLTGKSFGITLFVAADPQRFSLPRFSDPGAAPACSAGRSETVPVTLGGFSRGVPDGRGAGRAA